MNTEDERMQEGLEQWDSNCGPQVSSSNSIWKLVRNPNFGPVPQTTESDSETLQVDNVS